MKILIVGAGTIGLTYGWLLSSAHDVTVLKREQTQHDAQEKYFLTMTDLRYRGNQYRHIEYAPQSTTKIETDFDIIMVTVNRYQLIDVLPLLKPLAGKTDIIFMLNHWNIRQEIEIYIAPSSYLVGFPSQVGGGRINNIFDVVVFKKGTILSDPINNHSDRLIRCKHAFEQSNLKVEIKSDIFDWLKIHYLQQAISAGAILKSGSYRSFSNDFQAIKEMVYGYREGLNVCQMQGIDTKKTFPAKFFFYPAPLVALRLKKMFNQTITEKMITNHMKHGLQEWIMGFYEVLASGKEQGIPMLVWEKYKPFVDTYSRKY